MEEMWMLRKMLSNVLISVLTVVFVCWPVNAQNATESQENTTSAGQEAEQAPLDSSATQPMLTLPAGTPLNLIMLEELYSQRNREGDEIVFALQDDVVVMGRTFLVAGTPVIGRVTHTRAARSWGRSGSLDIEITSIAPPYGMPIALTGEAGTSGGSNTVASVATTALLGITVVGLLAGGAIAGHGAVIPAGTTFTVFTASDGSIMDLPRDEMQTMIDDWYTHKVITSFLRYSPAGVKTVSAAMSSMGYSVDESMVTMELIDQYNYRIEVKVSPTETASFSFQPFQDTHGWKFNTLTADNELAAAILGQVR
jgi:hypothetical protein